MKKSLSSKVIASALMCGVTLAPVVTSVTSTVVNANEVKAVKTIRVKSKAANKNDVAKKIADALLSENNETIVSVAETLKETAQTADSPSDKYFGNKVTSNSGDKGAALYVKTLRNKDGLLMNGMGSGVFIASNIFLTVSHVPIDDPGDTTVNQGLLVNQNTPVDVFKGKSAYGHLPNFVDLTGKKWTYIEAGETDQDGDNDDDIAMIVLDKPVQFTDPSMKVLPFVAVDANAAKNELTINGYYGNLTNENPGALYSMTGPIAYATDYKAKGGGPDNLSFLYNNETHPGTSGSGLIQDGKVIGVHQGNMTLQNNLGQFNYGTGITKTIFDKMTDFVKKNAITGFQTNGGKKYFIEPDGNMAKSKELTIDNKIWRFDATGVATEVGPALTTTVAPTTTTKATTSAPVTTAAPTTTTKATTAAPAQTTKLADPATTVVTTKAPAQTTPTVTQAAPVSSEKPTINLNGLTTKAPTAPVTTVSQPVTTAAPAQSSQVTSQVAPLSSELPTLVIPTITTKGNASDPATTVSQPTTVAGNTNGGSDTGNTGGTNGGLSNGGGSDTGNTGGSSNGGSNNAAVTTVAGQTTEQTGNDGKPLPKTGDAGSLLALVGTGLAAVIGFVFYKRKKSN